MYSIKICWPINKHDTTLQWQLHDYFIPIVPINRGSYDLCAVIGLGYEFITITIKYTKTYVYVENALLS